MENNLHSSNAGQGMGIASLIIGILAFITAFIPCFGLIAILLGVIAIIFGAIGYSQAKKGNASKSLPITGLIFGIVATGFVIIWILVVVGTIGTAALSAKDEISNAIDSIEVETARTKDSLNNDLEIMKDSVKNDESGN
jgi:predicted membrane protein